MDDHDKAKGGTVEKVGSTPKIWTALQHGSGLIAVLGLFLAVSSYLTDPESGAVPLGSTIAAVGVAGFSVGLIMNRRRRS